MRRERNQYIFASELTKRNRSHRFRNAVLILLPILIVSLYVLNITVSRRVKLEELKLTVLNLPDDLESYSILHLSDLHGARFGEGQKAIETALGTTRYSCVVMTGDMLGEDGDVQPLLELVALMPKDTPKFLIPGDTDGPAVETGAHSSLSVYTGWDSGPACADHPGKRTDLVRAGGALRSGPGTDEQRLPETAG